MEDQGVDVHKDSPSPPQHRLPTVSGIEALRNATAKAKGISSGLPALDSLLLPRGLSIAIPGVQRGCVTEVFGPPGIGKTTFGLQVAANALCASDDGSHVLWVDTGSPLIADRLWQIIGAHQETNGVGPPSSHPQPSKIESLLEEKFVYLDAHSPPRLLTLFLHPTRSFPSSKTCLIVIDDLSNLLLGSFSRAARALKPAAPAAVKEKWEKRAAGRRFQIIENLAAAMSKMAALRNTAILVLTNATISLRAGQKAILKPALSSQAWDTAIHTRIMLYRDLPDGEQESEMSLTKSKDLRYAEVQRLAGKDVYSPSVPFVIVPAGLHGLSLSSSDSEPEPATATETRDTTNGAKRPTAPDEDLLLLPVELSQPSQPLKRKAMEIADSEDEDELDLTGDFHEPELPPMASREGDASPKEDEMILDAHETAVLRSYRYASIRGSEDAIPISSSDMEEDIEDDPREG